MSSSPSVATRADQGPPGAAQPAVSVLLVDDNANKRLALKSILRPLGYGIVEADSGLAALREVMTQSFAVILLDVRMPLMDGFETAALIRQRWQCETTPIIFITAYATDEIENADRYAEGAVDFLSAPVVPDELRAKVSAFGNIFRNAEVLAARASDAQVSAGQFRLLTEAAPIGIFQTDTERRYVYTNPRWSELTGVRPEEARGQVWQTSLGEGARGLDMPEGQSELSHRFELPAGAGVPRVVLVTFKAIPAGDHGLRGWIGTLADVTAEAGAQVAISEARDAATARRD